jgi:putative DNA primase/helicase
VPFEVQIPEEKKDLKLAEKLRAEWPGILAWAARGARDWYRGGLQPPQKVLAATAEYRDEMDAIGQFVRDCFYQGPQFTGVTAAMVYEAYVTWAKSHGEYAVAQRRLSRLLKERGFETVKVGGRRVYQEWGLKGKDAPDADDDDDDD